MIILFYLSVRQLFFHCPSSPISTPNTTICYSSWQDTVTLDKIITSYLYSSVFFIPFIPRHTRILLKSLQFQENENFYFLHCALRDNGAAEIHRSLPPNGLIPGGQGGKSRHSIHLERRVFSFRVFFRIMITSCLRQRRGSIRRNMHPPFTEKCLWSFEGPPCCDDL